MKIALILKEKQVKPNEKYLFTHFEEPKLVSCKYVEYYIKNEAQALASFKWDEVELVMVDGVRLRQKNQPLNYRDLLVRILTDTNRAFLHSNALESGDLLYGELKLSYQGILDLLNPVVEDLKRCIAMLEILNQKRA